MMESMEYEHLLIFGSFVIAAWFIVMYFLPGMLMSVFEGAILVKGFGDGPGPVNTLYTQPQELFIDPLHASGSKRPTGTKAGAYLINGPGWKGSVPRGVSEISSPNNSVLVIGRVLSIATTTLTFRSPTDSRSRYNCYLCHNQGG